MVGLKWITSSRIKICAFGSTQDEEWANFEDREASQPRQSAWFLTWDWDHIKARKMDQMSADD